ncbi:transglycosylase domain-containing protein [Flavobacterium sp. NRK1]|uniref:transglycosylase domain-containing protein n=1 Tax=Flavobacterium sp. NRK1 TaxID=2954929 RepID=UPI0020929BAE|nr:transglycosylase domain-containing protein [Flavobacterium sp. NRK1]MCO6147802.1 transglycosylase domain-containing protein [Flavobacterium sp. NRK1]
MRKKNGKQIALLVLKIAVVVIILSVISFFAFRNVLLNKAIARISDKMSSEYNSSFVVKEATFKGLSRIEMKGISLTPKNADTLLRVNEIKTSINLSRLLTADIQLGTLGMQNGFIQLVKNANGKNFDAFLRKKDKEELNDDNEGTDYASRAYKLLHRALNLVPTDMRLKNLTLRLDDMGRKVTLNLMNLKLEDKQLESTIGVSAKDIAQNWKVKGFADPRNKQANLDFFNTDTTRIEIPYLNERYGLKSGFDSIHLNVDNIEMDSGQLHVDGYASIRNFMINHARIAKKDVVIDNARFDYRFLFGSDFIALDSTSTMQLNKIKVKPFLKYSIAGDTIYELKAHIPKMQAQDFIVSLPNGLFTNFEGMEAEGSFSYDLNFMYNKNKPNALVFDSSLKKDGLKIIKYGEADLAKLNTGFTYRAIDNGRVQRPVLLTESNPYYTPLDQISPYLRKAVLTSEDPSFFNHRGFINEAFKQSIIKNIKTKKFSRGASTISMQLVKNVFLTREKTLSRKLEEILLVYILENNRIASKERMLEVYFNIIEWGPDVYGIGEAASYYFDKSPSQLTLDECVYLASIIPRPKGFMWQFNDEGNLKPFAVKHNDYIKQLMLRRGLLVPEDTILQSGNISVTGRARASLRLKQVNPFENDTTGVQDFFFNLGKRAF